MTPFHKDTSFVLQRNFLIVFALAIFASILLLTEKQERKIASHNKPCCLKGYICQAVTRSIGR